jgi:hypothetical protein
MLTIWGMDGRMEGRMAGWKDGRWKDGRMNGWKEGWKDEG